MFGASKQQIGIIAVVAIVGLRMVIGLHFFKEGAEKKLDPKPFSGGFFANAKGPFAGSFRSLAWDTDGRARLGYAQTENGPAVDQKPTETQWNHYKERAAAHYGFTQKQKSRAGQAVKQRIVQLEQFVLLNEDDIVEYFHSLDRRERNRENPAYVELPGLQAHAKRIESESRKKGAPLIAEVDAMWVGLEDDIQRIATSAQRQLGQLELIRLGRQQMDSVEVDKLIPYFDMAIGMLLIVGLFTRIAAVAGGAFLASVVASQWPGSEGAIATWPQMIEMLALFALAGLAAGHYFGLDAAIHSTGRLLTTPRRAAA
ncbi:MAG: hypothetical protein QF805_19525 [Pirellulaceae bacterium]|nr:hypothetical protein [Pirellulaceae bacterium]